MVLVFLPHFNNSRNQSLYVNATKVLYKYRLILPTFIINTRGTFVVCNMTNKPMAKVIAGPNDRSPVRAATI